VWQAWLVVVALFLVLAPRLGAQTATTGALTGTVTDPTGASVPNTAVTATNTDTGAVRTMTTGADGNYRFGLLRPGSYRLRFETAGFSTVEVPSVTVNVTETAVFDRSLEVGTQTQQITVEGEAETVQTTDATVGTVLVGKAIADLPLTSRNYTNLLGLSAGANTGVFNASTLGRGTQDIAVNGGSLSQNNYLMDGAPIGNFAGNGIATDNASSGGIGIANPDSIQEFKIQTSLFDAGYGRKPGANVNVVTKSGSNQFHGTAFEFFRNAALNANDFFRNQSYIGTTPNNSRQVLNQNQYGGTFGGPVKKDKLFFFVSYQESWQKNGIAAQGYSAPSLFPIFPGGDRSNTAALQASLGATFCPTTGTDGGKTSNGGVQVNCNGLNINPVALAILQLKNSDGSYYVPSSGPITGNGSTTSVQNTTFSIPALYKEHQAVANMDYAINSKNTLTTKYFFSTDPTQATFNCGLSGGAPGTCLPDTAAKSEFGAQDGVIKLTSIVTNSFVNEVRLSVQRNTTSIFPGVPFTNNQVGIANIFPGINNLDQIIITGGFTIGTVYTSDFVKYVTGGELADQASWSHGKQTFRFGGEFERQRINWSVPGDSIGSLTFQTFQDFLLGLPGCTPGTACSASSPGATNGTSSSNVSNSGRFAAVGPATGGYVNFRSPAGNAFMQDDIKFSPRFTVNLGLRWEYSSTVYAQNGNLTNIWPNLINTVPIPGSTPATGTLAGYVVPSNYNFAANPPPPVGGLFQNSRTIGVQHNTPLDNFAPRVGFAWQPTSSNRFVVRGGFGYFYDRLGDSSYTASFVFGSPYLNLVQKSGAANYFSTLAQPYAPASPGWVPRWVNFTAGTSSNITNYVMSPTYLTPLVDEWNLNTQYEFLPTWVLEVGYVGSHGIHQPVIQQLINQAQLVGNPLGNNIFSAPGIAAGLVTSNTAANASLRVPYLGFAPAGLISNSTNGSDKFNSLQVTVRKQLSHGLSFQAAYAWSKSLASATGFYNNDANNYGQQYGLNSSYRPQRLSVNYNWDLPLGHSQGLTGKLMNGWTLSGVTILQDGTPLTISDTRGGTVYGFGPGSLQVSTAEYCPGMGAANAASTGSDKQRLGGFNGGQGWFNKAGFFGLGTNGGCSAAGATGTPAIGSDGSTGYGNSSIGIALGPGQFNWDMSLVKTTKVGGIREDATLQFRTEFFNAFNHAQFSNPAVTDVSKGTFGQITSTSVNPRLIQFALKYLF